MRGRTPYTQITFGDSQPRSPTSEAFLPRVGAHPEPLDARPDEDTS
jgi:hypothetical protein